MQTNVLFENRKKKNVRNFRTLTFTQPLFLLGGCTSNTPVFMAALTADLDHCNNNAKIIFQNVKINQGSGYSGGVFTAPVAGYYAFSATLSTSDNNQYHVAFVKDNDSNKIGYMYADPSSIWMQRSSTVMTHLNQNEKVWMMCLGDSRIEGDHQHHYSGATDFHSHMSGFLVSAD